MAKLCLRSAVPWSWRSFTVKTSGNRLVLRQDLERGAGFSVDLVHNLRLQQERFRKKRLWSNTLQELHRSVAGEDRSVSARCIQRHLLHVTGRHVGREAGDHGLFSRGWALRAKAREGCS